MCKPSATKYHQGYVETSDFSILRDKVTDERCETVHQAKRHSSYSFGVVMNKPKCDAYTAKWSRIIHNPAQYDDLCMRKSIQHEFAASEILGEERICAARIQDEDHYLVKTPNRYVKLC